MIMWTDLIGKYVTCWTLHACDTLPHAFSVEHVQAGTIRGIDTIDGGFVLLLEVGGILEEYYYDNGNYTTLEKVIALGKIF